VRYEEIDGFPPVGFKETLKEEQVRSLLVDHFPNNCSGTILVPGHQFNSSVAGYYYGVF
jgi:hypothetical protein